jgi:hypothetical protein
LAASGSPPQQQPVGGPQPRPASLTLQDMQLVA